MANARYILGGCGTQTSALAFGGGFPPVAFTEEYDGTSWTSGGTMNTARNTLAEAGIQTAALAFGGNSGPGTSAATELWNGTSWTTNPNSMATGRQQIGGCGTQTAALGFGGYTPPVTAATEEWTGTQTLTRTVTVS